MIERLLAELGVLYNEFLINTRAEIETIWLIFRINKKNRVERFDAGAADVNKRIHRYPDDLEKIAPDSHRSPPEVELSTHHLPLMRVL